MYPHRKFPMFGNEIECWQMQAFFERIKYSDDSLNCRLAQSFNHICGCEGSGYAGANTDAKKAALVWLPRIMAILSILVSICMLNILYATIKPNSALSLYCSLSGIIFHHLWCYTDTFTAVKVAVSVTNNAQYLWHHWKYCLCIHLASDSSWRLYLWFKRKWWNVHSAGILYPDWYYGVFYQLESL